GFTVDYFDTYKVLTNSITNEKYALVCCNQSLSNFTSGYHAVVNTPLSTVSVDQALSTLPFFELLGLSNRVLAIQPSANVTSPCYANISDSPGGNTVDAVFTTQSSTAAVNTKPQYISISSQANSLTPIQSGNIEQINKSTHNMCLLSIGMKLVAKDNQSTVYQNVSLFQEAVRDVDYIIDASDSINTKKDFAYGDWLSALGLTPNSNMYSFLTNQDVYRTDKMISTTGQSDWVIRHSARADLAISDIIHMVYNTYEPTYNTTWIRSFARLQSPTFITNTSYPSCTNTIQRLEMNTCAFAAFKPNTTIDVTPKKSKNPNIHQPLSTGGK
ncbi:hypothetical protein EDC96DRAFT_429627, partial [Choanephora cucurbitarum]